MLKYFFECYFNQSADFNELDTLIQDFKKLENDQSYLQFITELNMIIQTKSYKVVSKIIDKYGGRTPDLCQAEELIKYIYNKLIDQPAHLNMSNFIKDCKVVFCPVCCPDPEIVTTYSLIQKAIVVKNNQAVYICKPCKLVWLTEDIQADNAQDYKKFMKSLGLKGLWKELSNIDLL